jgi:hypothetical protein
MDGLVGIVVLGCSASMTHWVLQGGHMWMPHRLAIFKMFFHSPSYKGLLHDPAEDLFAIEEDRFIVEVNFVVFCGCSFEIACFCSLCALQLTIKQYLFAWFWNHRRLWQATRPEIGNMHDEGGQSVRSVGNMANWVGGKMLVCGFVGSVHGQLWKDDVVDNKMKLRWDCDNDGFAMKPASHLGGGKAGQAPFEIWIWRGRDWMIPKLGDRLDQNRALIWLWFGKRSFGIFNVQRTARANSNFRKH